MSRASNGQPDGFPNRVEVQQPQNEGCATFLCASRQAAIGGGLRRWRQKSSYRSSRTQRHDVVRRAMLHRMPEHIGRSPTSVRQELPTRVVAAFQQRPHRGQLTAAEGEAHRRQVLGQGGAGARRRQPGLVHDRLARCATLALEDASRLPTTPHIPVRINVGVLTEETTTIASVKCERARPFVCKAWRRCKPTPVQPENMPSRWI